jgi:hypothetical protein
VQEGKKTAGCCETVATVVKDGGNWCGGFVVVVVVVTVEVVGQTFSDSTSIHGTTLRGTLLETCHLISVQGFVCV